MRSRLTTLSSLPLILACSDAAGPSPRPGAHFVSGAGQTDTAYAHLPRPLVVEVRESNGALASGVTVNFNALRSDDSFCPVLYTCSVILSDSVGNDTQLLTRTTDARGRASANVQLGPWAGRGGVAVAAQGITGLDSAFFVITAAAPAHVVAVPKDTALYVAAGFTLRGVVTDQFGNPRSDSVAYASLGGTVTISGGRVTANTIGRVAYVVSAHGMRDTGWVSVVPNVGSFAAIGAAGLAVMNMDGSGYVLLAPSNNHNNGYARWANPPDSLAVDYAGNDKLSMVDLSGHIRAVLSAGDSGISMQDWPAFSRDGSWIYFQGDYRLWRVHSDGSGLSRVGPAAGVTELDFSPTPSPDGAHLVFEQAGRGLVILDLATDSVTPLGVGGYRPRWSPIADSIVFVSGDGNGRIMLIAADGTGLRSVTDSTRYFTAGLDWSSDAQWILARDTYAIDLISVSTGAILPLGYTTGMSLPVWRP